MSEKPPQLGDASRAVGSGGLPRERTGPHTSPRRQASGETPCLSRGLWGKCSRKDDTGHCLGNVLKLSHLAYPCPRIVKGPGPARLRCQCVDRLEGLLLRKPLWGPQLSPQVHIRESGQPHVASGAELPGSEPPPPWPCWLGPGKAGGNRLREARDKLVLGQMLGARGQSVRVVGWAPPTAPWV